MTDIRSRRFKEKVGGVERRSELEANEGIC